MTGEGLPPLDPRERVDEEIRHHLDEKADFLVASGWEREQARREAERRFGSVRRIRRRTLQARRERAPRPGETVRQAISDLRYALRSVRHGPGFTAALVATLALGIGAASSIFAVVDALLLRPMPYADAERWVELHRSLGGGRYAEGMVGEGGIRRWQAAAVGLTDGWVAYVQETLVRTDGPEVARLDAVAVTPGAEALLGIRVRLGRAFTPRDGRPGAPPVVLLAQKYWRRLGADPGILGRTIHLESGPATVVGVLTGGVRFPEYGPRPDLWLPLRDDLSFADREPPGPCALASCPTEAYVWARLVPELDAAAAQERFDVLARQLQEEYPSERSWRVSLVPVGSLRAQPDTRRAVWTLTATVAALFLIALVNGVNLTLGRASTRSRELALRMAVGASPGRLLRQLLAEGLLYGTLGGGAAAGLARAAVAALGAIVPSDVTYFSPYAFQVEGRTLLFVFGVSFLVGTLLGLIPGVQALRLRRDPLSGRRGREDSPAGRRVRRVLVTGQVALSMTLLVAAGLMVKGFARLLAVDPGFDVQRVALASIGLSPIRYPDGIARAEILRRLKTALEAHPAIEAVSLASGAGWVPGRGLEAEGEAPPAGRPSRVPRASVGPGFFETMGIDVVEGRALNVADAGTGNVVVDRDLARLLWGSRTPVGRRFRTGVDGEWWTVVGVVGELRLLGRDQRDAPCQFLTALDPDRVGRQYVQLAMRTSGAPEALLPVFRRTLRTLDPQQWIWKLGTASDSLAEEEEKPRFLVTLMALLAGVAVTLSAVGLYGVLAYSVSRRRRELGVRVALGADRGRVRGMVLGEGLRVAALGVALGIGGATLTSPLVGRLLYEVEPGDPTTVAAASALFLLVAAAACLVPAVRATRVDPVRVLQAD